MGKSRNRKLKQEVQRLKSEIKRLRSISMETEDTVQLTIDFMDTPEYEMLANAYSNTYNSIIE